MTVERLLDELDVGLQPGETEMFYRELAAVARDHASFLGPDQPRTTRPESVEKLISQLGQDVVELSPQLEVIPLKKSRFEDLGLSMSPYLADLFRQFRFYLVNIPVTIVPKSGWNFVKLECIVEFNPEQVEGNRPVAYQVLPPDAWRTLIQAQQSLRIGLNENLEFKVETAQLSSLLPGLPEPLRAGVDVAALGSASLVVGPFDYTVRRPVVLTKGGKTPKVYWHMEGSEAVTHEEPRLGVVLQVPKDVTQVDVAGAVKATRKFSMWAAWLDELLSFVRESTASFFRSGAPKPDGKLWQDITKGL